MHSRRYLHTSTVPEPASDAWLRSDNSVGPTPYNFCAHTLPTHIRPQSRFRQPISATIRVRDRGPEAERAWRSRHASALLTPRDERAYCSYSSRLGAADSFSDQTLSAAERLLIVYKYPDAEAKANPAAVKPRPTSYGPCDQSFAASRRHEPAFSATSPFYEPDSDAVALTPASNRVSGSSRADVIVLTPRSRIAKSPLCISRLNTRNSSLQLDYSASDSEAASGAKQHEIHVGR
ncbi:unnamed protein product [Protopolystoma xenopodis]|uniref:Uncharacterized protein n=1 Tax=Protopolystoma xenopodis TaxID=117903 RepID=A0A3S5CHA2_9PLAT|nr:unnamed protein product [Protopolystoma xenopodis]